MSTLTLTRELPRLPAPVIVSRILRLELGGLFRRLSRLFGAPAPAALSLDDLAVPDSALVDQATALVRSIEPDFVFNHSVRTYLYGAAVGSHLGLEADRELLYLAAIFHDVGLMPDHGGHDSFELQSAHAAHGFLSERGVDEARAALVHEAIALHTSAGIAGSREPEIALTHFGAGLDVLGARYEDVAADTHAAILEAWPRERFKEQFTRLLADEASSKPACHMAGPMSIGFGKKIAAAPFAE